MDTLKITPNKYKFIFNNETVTIINLLVKQFLKHEDVKYSGYDMNHPLESKSHLILETYEKNPRELFNECIDEILNDIKELKNI